ncbi:LemA family protein [Candidatus Nomurabacteria bacterium]|nr:LemA family protein [Candidatus Nomurabacteria bacterium]
MLYIILGIIAVLVLWLVFGYNSFITLRNRAQEAWADIDVQLKRRYDLIPNLVNTVKGYATHESSAFEKVTEARAAAMGAKTIGEHATTEANVNFLELQRELSDTENKIQASRRFYNGNVRELNTGIQAFPGNLIASMFNFSQMEFYQLEEGSIEKNTVEVKF